MSYIEVNKVQLKTKIKKESCKYITAEVVVLPNLPEKLLVEMKGQRTLRPKHLYVPYLGLIPGSYYCDEIIYNVTIVFPTLTTRTFRYIG